VTLRPPDFLIIGAKKAGTTTLFRWLAALDEVGVPPVKEPNFFTSAWDRGPAWYQQLFAGVAPGQVAGEASTSYTDPAVADLAAERIRVHRPDVRLVFLARHPVDRLRSDYRHEMLRGRERRPLAEAVIAGPYVARSCYRAVLEPYVSRFEREQLAVIRSEDLFDDSPAAWERVLGFLGLTPRPRPTETHNVSADRAQYTRAMRWLWERGMSRSPSRAPAPLRRLGRRVLLRDDERTRHRVRTASGAPLAAPVIAELRADAERLARWLGAPAPLWDITGG
jgi:hypothetical protein